MATDKELRQAQNVYKIACDTLDDMGWVYNKDESILEIYTGAGGDDHTISIRICVEPEKNLVTILSEIEIGSDKDSMVPVSIAVSLINNRLVDGSFDYNILTGQMFFRITSSYKNSLISKEVFDYMVYIVCHTVDEYDGKLISLSKGEMNFDEFVEFINK